MTDNRTNELREKLTERGVEYTTNDHMCVCETSWNGFTAMQLTPGAKLLMVFTPDQAIAATLGSRTVNVDDILDLLDEMNHVESISYDIYSQLHDAIAELGSGTCEMRLLWCDYEDGECYECSSCEGMTYTHGWEPSYCERCGAKVVKR